MALGMGQMPMQPGGVGQVNPMGAPRTSLGFPRLPTTPPPGGPTMHPMDQPPAMTPPTPAPSAAPTGVMPTNPAATASLPQNAPVSVVGAPVPASPPIPVQQHGLSPDFAQRMQDRITQVAQSHPGFLARMQSVLGQGGGSFFNHLERRAPAFDWRSFVANLTPPAPAVGAGTAPAAAPAPVAAPQPGAAPANGVIFNPLNLPGIGG